MYKCPDDTPDSYTYPDGIDEDEDLPITFRNAQVSTTSNGKTAAITGTPEVLCYKEVNCSGCILKGGKMKCQAGTATGQEERRTPTLPDPDSDNCDQQGS